VYQKYVVMKKIIIFLLLLPIVSCSDFWWASSDATNYLILQVENYNSEFSVVKLSIINNEFEDLNIISGEFQDFELTNQVTGDLSDINILVDVDCISQGKITLSTQLDFSNGTAIIRIIDSNYDADVIMNCEDAAIWGL